MKALLLQKHGTLDDLKVVSDYPVPKAVEGHVVIRVRASSFNYHDVFTMRGMPGIKVPLPVVIGLDMAGEIAEVGPGVAKWKAGDQTFPVSALCGVEWRSPEVFEGHLRLLRRGYVFWNGSGVNAAGQHAQAANSK